MKKTKEYVGLDYFRLIGAILIVAIHTSPLTSVNITADFILTRILGRVAVPFFLMVSGFFLLPPYMEANSVSKGKIMKSIKKISFLYGISVLLYLPIILYNGYFREGNLGIRLIQDIIFNGTFYHLWYLPASILGLLILWGLLKRLPVKIVLIITTILYVIGLFGDSYYGIIAKLPGINSFYELLFHCFDYTRNGIFYAPIFLLMGGILSHSKQNVKKANCVVGLLVSTILLLAEGLILHRASFQRHDSMYVFLIPTMYYLFMLLFFWKAKSFNSQDNKIFSALAHRWDYPRSLRFISMTIYVIHPLGIIVIRGCSKVMGLQKLFIENSLLHFLAVSIFSFVFAMFFYYFITNFKNEKPNSKGRAWIEINLKNLRHNINELYKTLPPDCEIMAVVKANAYGHGDIPISKELSKSGISSFAVAALSEGIRLRKKGIKGKILIFGYTHPSDFKYLVKYHLIQTVVDYDYAKSLNSYGRKIQVHIKLDTGMHRLGESYENLSHIEGIFQLPNLVIEGVYTHLSVSDSLREADILFTNSQIDSFYNTIDLLNKKGYNPKKLHIQSSYGVLNYPGLTCDYARVGIALYGILSSYGDKTIVNANLLPVLSIKSRIVLTKRIFGGETVSYGNEFQASKDMDIAVVSIGYADGIPRNLTNASLLIHGMKAPIIGRICMDQLILDITGIKGVQQNDIVTVIGKNGDVSVGSAEIATKSHTIANELLSRLGTRLKRIYIFD